jgi:hypothetical protein
VSSNAATSDLQRQRCAQSRNRSRSPTPFGLLRRWRAGPPAGHASADAGVTKLVSFDLFHAAVGVGHLEERHEPSPSVRRSLDPCRWSHRRRSVSRRTTTGGPRAWGPRRIRARLNAKHACAPEPGRGAFVPRVICRWPRVFNKPLFLEDRQATVESGPWVVENFFKSPGVQQRRHHRFLTGFRA